MKIFAAYGSPRKNGNTSNLIDRYLKGVEENHSDVEVTKAFLQDKNIEKCRGCMACQTGKIKNCITKDDMSDLYQKIEEADVLVFSTPIYFFSMSSQLKVLVDRLIAVNHEMWKNKKIVLLTTYGDENEISSGAINLTNIMKQIASYAGADFIQNYGVSTQMDNEFVVKDEKTLEEVYELGKNLLLDFNNKIN